MDWKTTFLSFCLGVGLASAVGFRVFLPLLLAGLAMRFQLLPDVIMSNLLPTRDLWLSSDAALICFAVAAVVEILAYKIPVVDNLLDAAGAPIALFAGAALVSSTIVGIDDPLIKYGLGAIAGASSAGAVYGATSAVRLASTKATGGIANPFLAVGEAIAAAVTSAVAIFLPVLAFVLFLAAVLIFLWFWRRLRLSGGAPPAAP